MEENDQADAENDPGVDADDGLTQDAKRGGADESNYARGNAIEEGVRGFVFDEFFNLVMSDQGEGEGWSEDRNRDDDRAPDASADVADKCREDDQRRGEQA